MRKNTILKKAIIAGMLSVMSIGSASAVEFGAFANAKYSNSDAVGESGAFAIGGLDLYAFQEIDEKTSGFIEYVFENDGEGFVLDLERLWVKRSINEKLSLAIGRFHSPLGYWNRNMHHGVLLQDTAGRPGFLDFEDGDSAILPLHVVGLMANGALTNEISYELSVGNSPSINSADAQAGNAVEIGIGNVADQSDGKSVGGRVTYKPAGRDYSVSAFAMQNSVVDVGGAELVSQTISGIDARYENGPFDVLTEYYSLKNDSQTSFAGNANVAAYDASSHTGTAYYVQFGYQATEVLKATYRYEDVAFDLDDAYFALLGKGEETHNVLSFRYDLDDSNAVKVEFNRAEPVIGDDSTSVVVDWEFMMI